MSFGGRNHPHPRQEQWDRVLRWQERLRQASGGPDEVVDTAFALFTCVNHMWDWVLATHPEQKASLRRLIGESQELQLVRDVANGSKHWKVRDPSVDADHFLALEYIPPPFRPPSGPSHRFILCAGGAKHELLPLAWRAVETWERHLRDEALLTRP